MMNVTIFSHINTTLHHHRLQHLLTVGHYAEMIIGLQSAKIYCNPG